MRSVTALLSIAAVCGWTACYKSPFAHCSDPGGCKRPLVCHKPTGYCVMPDDAGTVDGGGCPGGYTGTDGNCADIDECDAGVSLCGPTAAGGGSPDGGPADGGGGGGGGGSAGGGTAACDSRTCPDTCCGTACVKLASDVANCGACSHDCGRGAQCQGGVCTPADLTLQPVNLSGGVAVDATGIYFADRTKLLTCPLDGCTLTPRQVWSETLIQNVTAVGGLVGWEGLSDQGHATVEFCSAASCTPTAVATSNAVLSVGRPKLVGPSLFYDLDTFAPSPVGNYIVCFGASDGGCAGLKSVSGASPFASDGTSLAYVPMGSGAPATYVACPLDATSCAPIGLMPTAGVLAVAASGGTLFTAWSGLVGPNQVHQIQSCPVSGCTAATKVTNTPLSETVVDLAADSSGVYWALGGDAGSIWMCPGTSCTGGARQLAAQQGFPTSLQLFGNFVYWGAAGPTAGTSALRRVAKPNP